MKFLLGPEEDVILGHIALVAARSGYLRNIIRQAKENRDLQLETLFGTSKVPLTDIPLVEVKLPDANPEAFEMVLNYIYMDCIDPTKQARDDEDPVSNRIVLRMMDVYRYINVHILINIFSKRSHFFIRLAVQFKMARLEQLCVQYLNGTISLKKCSCCFT